MRDNTRHIEDIYMRLNRLNRKAAWTSERASQQMGIMMGDFRERMEEYLEAEFPNWRNDPDLKELFNRE